MGNTRETVATLPDTSPTKKTLTPLPQDKDPGPTMLSHLPVPPTPEFNAANIQAIVSSLAAIQTQSGAGKEPPHPTSDNSWGISLREKKKPAKQKKIRMPTPDDTSREEDEIISEDEGSDSVSEPESDP